MLNIQTDGSNMRIEHTGDPINLGIEMGLVVSQIYNALRSDDVTAAEIFKTTCITCLSPDSAAWEPIKNQVVIKIPVKKAVPPPTKVRAPHNLKIQPHGAV